MLVPGGVGDKEYRPSYQGGRRTKGTAKISAGELLESTGSRLAYVRYFDDFPCTPFATLGRCAVQLQGREGVCRADNTQGRPAMPSYDHRPR